MSEAKRQLQAFDALIEGCSLDGLLIGGHAVNYHGYSRLTVDFDFLIRRRTLDAWADALAKAGYRQSLDAPNFVRFSGPPDSPALDVMLVNDSTFEKLAAKSVAIGIGSLKAVSAPHLIALKVHALAHDVANRRFKDFLDVIEIVAANHIDLNSPEMKAILERYGNPELNQRIRKACDQDESKNSDR